MAVSPSAAVVAFLQSQGVNRNILSAKGFGATHPIAPTTRRKAGRKTAGSKSCSKGQALDPANRLDDAFPRMA